MANDMSVTAEEIEEFLRSAGKQGAQAMADAVAAQKFADVHVRIVWDVPDLPPGPGGTGGGGTGGSSGTRRTFASTFVDFTPELPARRSSAVSDSHDSNTYQVTVSIHTQARDSAELRHEVSRAGGIAELVAVEIARRQTLAKQYKNSLGITK